MAHIEWELTQGQWALIDTEDWPKIEPYKWRAHWSPKTKSYYAITHTKKDDKWHSTMFMHRLILGLGSGKIDKRQPDHINHNTLDNRKENIRITTNQLNQHNKKIEPKGYYFDKTTNKWKTAIRIDKIKTHLGYFNTEAEACQAYQDKKKELGFTVKE